MGWLSPTWSLGRVLEGSVLVAALVLSLTSCAEDHREPALDPAVTDVVRELKRTNDLLQRIAGALEGERQLVDPSGSTS